MNHEEFEATEISLTDSPSSVLNTGNFDSKSNNWETETLTFNEIKLIHHKLLENQIISGKQRANYSTGTSEAEYWKIALCQNMLIYDDVRGKCQQLTIGYG